MQAAFVPRPRRYDLPETLLLAVARGESDFEPTARSKANAHGVMQILWPTTARHLGIYRLSELYDPCTNIDAGARYLKELVARFDGNLHLALAAYNYGPERISADVANIPKGATWYSGYIYRHLDYVLGDGRVSSAASGSLSICRRTSSTVEAERKVSSSARSGAVTSSPATERATPTRKWTLLTATGPRFPHRRDSPRVSAWRGTPR